MPYFRVFRDDAPCRKGIISLKLLLCVVAPMIYCYWECSGYIPLPSQFTSIPHARVSPLHCYYIRNHSHRPRIPINISTTSKCTPGDLVVSRINPQTPFLPYLARTIAAYICSTSLLYLPLRTHSHKYRTPIIISTTSKCTPGDLVMFLA
jgi:hypothetical protein